MWESPVFTQEQTETFGTMATHDTDLGHVAQGTQRPPAEPRKVPAIRKLGDVINSVGAKRIGNHFVANDPITYFIYHPWFKS